MEYTIKDLAEEYIKYLNTTEINVNLPPLPTFETTTYNDYIYQKLMKEYESIYQFSDSMDITENFLKGE